MEQRLKNNNFTLSASLLYLVSMEQRLKNNKKKLETLSKQQLEEKLRSTIVSKLNVLGENLTEADSDDVISVCVIDNAAKSYKQKKKVKHF